MSIIKVNYRGIEGCAPPGQETAVIYGVREIEVYLSPAQLQDSFRVPCVFINTGWGIRKLTVKEVAPAMDNPQGNALEALVLDSVSDDKLISRILALPPVKALQFSLAVTLRIGSINGSEFKAEENFVHISPSYLLRDETLFRHQLKYRHTKESKYDDAAVEIGIWDKVKARVMGDKFSSESHGTIFDSLRRRMARRFKTNVLSRFIRYMKVIHDFPVDKDSDWRESEINKYLSAGVEALIWVGKSSFWDWDDGSRIMFWGWPKYIRRK